MEYRTTKVRRVLSTGFRKANKAKAQAAYDALRLGMGAKPKRSAMERFVKWAADERGLADAGDVTVAVAREFVNYRCRGV